MQYTYAGIEQLDLAAVQLHQDNPAYRRFALILTDNVVELLAYNRCKSELNLYCGRYPTKTRVGVLGNDFHAKLSFLATLGLLPQDELAFVGAAHEYRNESYHTGIVHDDIFHALAWHYHAVACELFVRLRPGSGFLWSESVRPSAVAAKHLGQAALGLWVDPTGLIAAAKSLGDARPQPEPDLADTLTKSILNRIDRIEGTLNYILENDAKSGTPEEAIRRMQFLHDFGSICPEGGYSLRDPEMAHRLEKDKYFMETQWRPKITAIPFARWKARAVHVRDSKSKTNALQSYANLGRDVAYFEEVVAGAGAALEMHIEEQIEMRRENRKED
jgi:hypothetical protein